jgi:hypothetical protein
MVVIICTSVDRISRRPGDIQKQLFAAARARRIDLVLLLAGRATLGALSV